MVERSDAVACPHGIKSPVVCPQCEPEKYVLAPAQRERLERLIRENGWRSE